MFDIIFWAFEALAEITKNLILDVKALSLDVTALFHDGWTSEIQVHLMHTLLDVGIYGMIVIKTIICIYPTVLLATITIEATTKGFDPGTPEEEQFLFLAISLFSAIILLLAG